MDWFGTNFCSKGVLWLALRGHPLPLICAVAIAIFRYTINRRYVFDVTSPTTAFYHQKNHGYPNIVPEVCRTPNWASKAPSPAHASQPFRLFVTNLRWLNKNRNHHGGTNKFPIFHEPPSPLDLSVNEWVVPSISPQSAKINVSQPPWIRESQSRITGASRLSAPSRVYHLASVSTNFIGLYSTRSEQPFHRQTRETAWKAKEREGIWRYITKVNFCWPVIFLECLIGT